MRPAGLQRGSGPHQQVSRMHQNGGGAWGRDRKHWQIGRLWDSGDAELVRRTALWWVKEATNSDRSRVMATASRCHQCGSRKGAADRGHEAASAGKERGGLALPAAAGSCIPLDRRCRARACGGADRRDQARRKECLHPAATQAGGLPHLHQAFGPRAVWGTQFPRGSARENGQLGTCAQEAVFCFLLINRRKSIYITGWISLFLSSSHGIHIC